jgi:regulator of protease activity HflC (stomatin/prohibitin superfamily)
VKESQVRRAEGEREAAILRAQGQAEARLTTAQAEAEALQKIAASLPEGQAAMYLLGQKYLESLPAIAQGKGSTVFLPVEAAGVMGALGGLREVLKAGGAGSLSTESPRALGAGPIDRKITGSE